MFLFQDRDLCLMQEWHYLGRSAYIITEYNITNPNCVPKNDCVRASFQGGMFFLNFKNIFKPLHFLTFSLFLFFVWLCTGLVITQDSTSALVCLGGVGGVNISECKIFIFLYFWFLNITLNEHSHHHLVSRAQPRTVPWSLLWEIWILEAGNTLAY